MQHVRGKWRIESQLLPVDHVFPRITLLTSETAEEVSDGQKTTKCLGNKDQKLALHLPRPVGVSRSSRDRHSPVDPSSIGRDVQSSFLAGRRGLGAVEGD
jgi:hypothetical protein